MNHPLDDYIGYRFIQIMKAHRSRAEAIFSEAGLHPGQEMLLFQLWEREGLTQSELAAQMCLDASTVTKSLQRMGQVGIVERRTDANDARVMRVYLTPQGRALEAPIRRMWAELEATTVEGLSEVELVLLRRLLRHIQSNFEGEPLV